MEVVRSLAAKYSLIYAKDLSVPPGGTTGNNEMVEFASLWAGLRYIVQTKAARAAIKAGRYYWLRIQTKER